MVARTERTVRSAAVTAHALRSATEWIQRHTSRRTADRTRIAALRAYTLDVACTGVAATDVSTRLCAATIDRALAGSARDVLTRVLPRAFHCARCGVCAADAAPACVIAVAFDVAIPAGRANHFRRAVGRGSRAIDRARASGDVARRAIAGAGRCVDRTGEDAYIVDTGSTAVTVSRRGAGVVVAAVVDRTCGRQCDRDTHPPHGLHGAPPTVRAMPAPRLNTAGVMRACPRAVRRSRHKK